MVEAAMPVTALMATGMRAVVISVIVHPRGPIDARRTHDTSPSTGSVSVRAIEAWFFEPPSHWLV